MCPLKLLKELLKLLTSHVTITKNFGEQPRANCFARMDWHYRRTTIGVVKEMVAAFDAENLKASFLQD